MPGSLLCNIVLRLHTGLPQQICIGLRHYLELWQSLADSPSRLELL